MSALCLYYVCIMSVLCLYYVCIRRTLLIARFIVVSLTTVTLFATMDLPTWAQDLKQVGLYYEGFVEDTYRFS